MKYTNYELRTIVNHGTKEVANFRRFLDSYKGDDKDILMKRYKEASLALDILREYIHVNELNEIEACTYMILKFSDKCVKGLSKEGVFYYLDKFCNLEPIFEDTSDDGSKKHIAISFIIY
jgi:hypothetical protein